MSFRSRLARFFGGAGPSASSDGGMLIESQEQLEQILRGTYGGQTASGAVVTPTTMMLNSVIYRCVDLISGSLAMLPWSLEEVGADGSVTSLVDHPLAKVLRRPNGWQTASSFKRLMQKWVLTHDGGAVAVKVMSRGRVIQLLPVHPNRVTSVQNDDMSLTYRVTRKNGASVTYSQDEVIHLRALSDDGVESIAPARAAREAIGLSMRTEEAAARLFRNGVMVGGVISVPGKLSPDSRESMRTELNALYSGAENAHRWLITDNGSKVEQRGSTAVDAQHLETRKHQVEEILRFFGVPRPLAMVDETSWGSGVEQLATLFVRFGLAPWFTTWEEEFARACLSDDEAKTMRLAIDENMLLRGSMKDQAEFFSRALGSGGSDGWLTPNEVRLSTGWGPTPGGDQLPTRAQSTAGQSNQGTSNVAP